MATIAVSATNACDSCARRREKPCVNGCITSALPRTSSLNLGSSTAIGHVFDTGAIRNLESGTRLRQLARGYPADHVEPRNTILRRPWLLDSTSPYELMLLRYPSALLHRQRQPQIGACIAPVADEPWRCDADDRGRHSADDDGLAEYVGAAEALLPQAIADDGDWLTIR